MRSWSEKRGVNGEQFLGKEGVTHLLCHVEDENEEY